MCVDEAYVSHAAVTAASLAVHMPGRVVLHLCVLESGQEKCASNTFSALTEPIKHLLWTEIHSIPTHVELGLPPNWSRAQFNRSIGLRLLLPKILPNDLERVLYLDADTLALHSLDPLWFEPLDASTLVAAVTDRCYPEGVPTAINRTGRWHRYFNTGVMLINLGAWRSERLSDECLALMKRYSDRLTYPDQDVLNYVIRDRWRTLPGRWNVLVNCPYEAWPTIRRQQALLTQSSILHYAGPRKPWHRDFPCGPLRDTYQNFVRLLRKPNRVGVS